MEGHELARRQPNLASRAMRRALLGFYRMQGWTAVGTPPPGGRYVIIAAPHTSNWDFLYFLGLANALGLDAHFMAKDSLFRWPLGGFMRDMGGVSIDRSARRNVVDAMIAEFARRDRFVLTIAPEGTRSAVKQWRTGFYQIALGAGVPMVVGLMDYATKTGGLGPAIMPTGDYRADMAQIAEIYRSVTPKHPDRCITDFSELLDG
ncbi:lysophospholipid acyltransferase family protein [Novosphingobium sp. KCTC 2891]|uniref:lysophospholipid acyltransferase family protein n=1 Tax=Novosphingobium sp. KCTC 2891 TaxID=2989730 RepID=UPI0022224924|nr:lysophospholipid acyltransferase family protein [Novosphingobium sp. KCTC 2891]MCW1383105.1 lysophospholipid acyltransferase family protein [Novosphingobium sp. KCTC 2891]